MDAWPRAIPATKGFVAPAISPDYAPIRDYAAIGDCHGSALIARSGSVDWCCLSKFDENPVFCRILDKNKGGYFSIRPETAFAVRRGYVGPTNILRTLFSTPSGRASVTDFMPVGRREDAGTHDYVKLNAPHLLVRIVDGLEGEVTLDVNYRPSITFAREPAALSYEGQIIIAANGPVLYLESLLRIENGHASGQITLQPGKRYVFILAPRPLYRSPIDEAMQLFNITSSFWEEWISYSRYQGAYRGMVRRSALALKMMTYAKTGAIVAALTTSLPEQIGGERNWDYRYCWLRDSAFTLYSLAGLGFGGEAKSFSEFLLKGCMQTRPLPQVLYGVEGNWYIPETNLYHLEGYRQSQPVRVGNEAYSQRQSDIYGQLLDWALLYQTLGGRFSKNDRVLLRGVADYVAANWRDPDQGLWEMRSPPMHHVHGKVMSWVAMDRALSLFGDHSNWRQERETIRHDILTHGLDSQSGHLVQAYGRREMDAALLLLPMLGFPLERPVLERTIFAVMRDLKKGMFVWRYLSEDGLKGDEGAFLICSFWLVDALLSVSRYHEARDLFESLLSTANDLGLYSEEIDTRSGSFLGNFPQAFTHLALIGSALNLQLYERHHLGAISGTYADRAKRSVTATFGWRAAWAQFLATGQVGRLFSSRRSMMPQSLL